jgi:hypothetical protein
MPPKGVGFVAMEIGDRSDLSEQAARLPLRRGAQRYSNILRASFSIALSGYGDDPRELWDVPEVVRFVNWWAGYAGMDDFETAHRILGADPMMCMGLLASCGVFGEEIKQQVVFTPREVKR